ncbi:MAG: hypothetical protein DRH43_05615 [Deltaproteobacteria bacterium]|nr:MAG: hypothetical protein DRH43_05615 [Deltaproteobacteria bacterium]
MICVKPLEGKRLDGIFKILFPGLSCRTKERPRDRLRRARPRQLSRSLQATRRLPNSFIPLRSPAGFFPLLVRRSGKTILSILSILSEKTLDGIYGILRIPFRASLPETHRWNGYFVPSASLR